MLFQAKKNQKNQRRNRLNEFNLSLPQDQLNQPFDTPLQPLESPSYEEAASPNILPSYQLFELTFSKSINPTSEDLGQNPPTYDVAHSPEYESGSYFDLGGIRVPSGDNHTTWESTILANVHRIKRLTDINPKAASHLKLSIHMTETSCRRGVKPKIIDTAEREYQQGDEVYGYVLIQNSGREKFNFDMFLVVFEGRAMVTGESGQRRPVTMYKFLNMFDYHASWTPADITGKQDSIIDPLDGTCLRFPEDKCFEPNVIYKMFFSFRIPSRLLDCACDPHSLELHCQMPPTIGLARDQFLQSIRKLRQKKDATTPNSFSRLSPIVSPRISPRPVSTPISPSSKKPDTDTRIKDLSFPDTALSYSIEARVISRSSRFFDLVSQDEFVLIEDASAYVRFIPRTIDLDLEMFDAEGQTIYKSLVHRIQHLLETGKCLLSGNPLEANEMLRKLLISKKRQLYTSDSRDSFSSTPELFSVAVPYKRKPNITSNPKVVGFFEMKSPYLLYSVKYIPPKKFPERFHLLGTKLDIPFELLFTPLAGAKPPEIKSICAEVIVCTFRSKKCPIPIHISPDMVFKNVSGAPDDLEHNLLAFFKKSLTELTTLSSKLDKSKFDVDNRLLMDIKTMADLSYKCHNLKVDDIHVKTSEGLHHWSYTSNVERPFYRKEGDVFLDLGSVLSKEVGPTTENPQKSYFTLVPTFQSCLLGRMYFLSIVIKFNNHDPVALKIPFTIKL